MNQNIFNVQETLNSAPEAQDNKDGPRYSSTVLSLLANICVFVLHVLLAFGWMFKSSFMGELKVEETILFYVHIAIVIIAVFMGGASISKKLPRQRWGAALLWVSLILMLLIYDSLYVYN